MTISQYDWLLAGAFGLINLAAWMRILRLVRSGARKEGGFVATVVGSAMCAVVLLVLVSTAVQEQQSALATRLQVDAMSGVFALAFLGCGATFFLYEFARATLPRVVHG
ncbi:MAG TPA: hypothetical protein VF916_01840 [Ktedonobacterales bacterium]|jgi:hypothetical protein